MQIEPSNPYSDSDHTPLNTRTAPSVPNPYAAPPVPGVTFTQQDVIGRNGAVEKQIVGTVTFGAFAYGQRGKVLWMQPGKSYLEFTDIFPNSANQAVFILPNAPTGDNWFKILAYSDLGVVSSNVGADHLFTVASVNTELTAPIIEQIGQSALTAVTVGVKNYSEKVRYRLIQVSNSNSFPAGANTVQSTHNFLDTVNIFGATETVTKTLAAINQFVRMAHSTDGVNFTAWSNVLPISFINESGYGLPELRAGGPLITLLGGNWFFTFYKPLKNGYNARNLEYRMLNDTNHKTSAGSWQATDTSITISNVTGLPPNGRMVIAGSHETFTYAGISGSTLTGCVRGLDKSGAQVIGDGVVIYPVEIQKALGDQLEVNFPQLHDTYYVEYRWTNDYFDNGNDGISQWSQGAIAYGTGDPVNDPPPPATPPAIPPAPPAGQENPYDPNNCFVSGTAYVWMADGSDKLLCDVAVGEFVKSEENGEIVERQILHKFTDRAKGFYRIGFADDVLQVTGLHPFKGWQSDYIRAKDLKAGSVLTAYQNDFIPDSVLSADKELKEVVTNNIEVEGTHRYFVRGDKNAKWKLVGNRKRDPGDPFSFYSV